MSTNDSKYIIGIENEASRVVYIGGSTEGTLYSIVPSEQQARRFETLGKVQACLDDPEFTKRINFNDGSSSPPSLIWSGLGINNAKRSAKGRVIVFQMKFEVVSVKDIFDQLK